MFLYNKKMFFCCLQREIEKLSKNLSYFGTNGLRSLVMAHRTLDEEFYERWNEEYQAASNSLVDRELSLHVKKKKVNFFFFLFIYYFFLILIFPKVKKKTFTFAPPPPPPPT